MDAGNKRLSTRGFALFLSLMMIISLLLSFACKKSPGKPDGEPNQPSQSHMVTFNANGGSVVTSQIIVSGETIAVPDFPVKTGYAFCGWYTDDNTFAKPYNFSNPVSGHVSLYARWKDFSPEMVLVPGGSFLMGSDDRLDLDAKPVRRVSVSGFYIARYQITQGQYHTVSGYNPSGHISGPEAPDCPVENLTWFDALEFCNKLSELEGFTPVYTIRNRTPAGGYPITGATVTPNWGNNGYRLPTEAEWEYAAKGGDGLGPYFIYSGSDDANAVAWYNAGLSSMAETNPIGKKAPNGLGIHDMGGNVWEWCWDWFEEYPDTPETNPRGPLSGSGRALRGGCWSLSREVIRSAYRNFYIPSITYNFIGIRPVRRSD
jgi:uncharacterized repeat protein (TIGR02543 family)